MPRCAATVVRSDYEGLNQSIIPSRLDEPRMRVLVTGASGFIGRHCIPYLLEAGHEVHAVVRTPVETSGPIWHRVDLLSPAAPSRLISIVQPAALLHLAWCTTHGEYWSSPENLRWAQASLELIHASSTAKCKRVVLAGTSAEYDWSFGVCSETLTPLRPVSLYGASKCAVYSVLEKFGTLAGMSWCWARIFNVYGPHEDPRRLVPSIIRSLLNRKEARIPVVEEKRDFLHVADVARALVMLVESGFSGAVNIGSGEAVTIQDMIQRIASALGQRRQLQMASTVSTVPLVQAQIDILTNEIGWKPRYSLETGVADAVAWWQGHSSNLLKPPTGG